MRDCKIHERSTARSGRQPAARRRARGRADRISDPKIKTSIEIIIRTAYPGQVRETNDVDPPTIPMLTRRPTGFFLWYRATTLIELWIGLSNLCLDLLAFISKTSFHGSCAVEIVDREIDEWLSKTRGVAGIVLPTGVVSRESFRSNTQTFTYIMEHWSVLGHTKDALRIVDCCIHVLKTAQLE